MDNNTPRLTTDNLPDDNYFIVRMCIHCQDAKQDMATPVPIPFPSLRLAKAMRQGMLEDAMDDDPTVRLVDGVIHRTDEDGDHRYVEAIIHITNKIVWRPGDDEQIDSKFNDIIGSFDLDTPTE